MLILCGAVVNDKMFKSLNVRFKQHVCAPASTPSFGGLEITIITARVKCTHVEPYLKLAYCMPFLQTFHVRSHSVSELITTRYNPSF